MSSRKLVKKKPLCPLCTMCDRPAPDGAVQASQIDMAKLKAWGFKVCEHDITKLFVLSDADLVCYFCIWQAQIVVQIHHVDAVDKLEWWPKVMQLDAAAKELQKYYFKGLVDQCWITMKRIVVPEIEDKEKTEQPSIENPVTEIKTEFEIEIEGEEQFPAAPESQLAFECNFCVARFASQSDCEAHINVSHPEYPVKCSEADCFSFFTCTTAMEAHVDSVHRKIHKCRECGKVFATNEKLLDHKNRVHHSRENGKQPEKKGHANHTCEHCGRIFPYTTSLKYHMIRVHETNKLNYCPHCPKAFPFVCRLNKHLKSKHNLPPI